MKFIPFDKFIIESDSSAAELRIRLSHQIEPKVNYRIGHYFSEKELKPYEGEIVNGSFKINRIIKHQNPLLPRIKGVFKIQYGGGSKIEIIIRLNFFVYLIVIFWSFAPILFFFSFSAESINENTLIPAIMVSLIWFILGYGVTYFAFNYERNKSKKFLMELFKPEMINN